MAGIFAGMREAKSITALALAGTLLCGCSLYGTEGVIISSRTDDGPGRAMPFRPGIYCPIAPEASGECVRLSVASASSYIVANTDDTFALKDDDPFLVHISAYRLTKGPLAGWQLAELCGAGDASCLLAAVRVETDKIAHIQVASCANGKKCAMTDLQEAIAEFEDESIQLAGSPIDVVWTRD